MIHDPHATIHDGHAPIHAFHATIHDPHAPIHDLHPVIRDIHPVIRDIHRPAEPEIHVMATPIKLRVSLNQFLADADRVAVLLEHDGDRLARVTDGAITATTAVELRKLVAEVREIEASPRQPSVATPSSMKPEVLRLVTRVAAAARWVGKTDPVLAARVERLSSECSVRGVPLAALPIALETWAKLVDAHETQLAELLGSNMGRRLSDTARAIRERVQQQKQVRAAATYSTARRNAAIERIRRVVNTATAAARLIRLGA